jgi:hypothetical protein
VTIAAKVSISALKKSLPPPAKLPLLGKINGLFDVKELMETWAVFDLAALSSIETGFEIFENFPWPKKN